MGKDFLEEIKDEDYELSDSDSSSENMSDGDKNNTDFRTSIIKLRKSRKSEK